MKIVKSQKIISVKPFGLQKTVDLEVDHPDHNFYAEGIVVSNSHARAYATLTAITTYLKANYPLEFFLADLKVAMVESESQKVIGKIYAEMKKTGVELLPPHLLKSDYDFKIEKNGIRFGLMAIKGLKEKVIEKVERFRNPQIEGAKTEENTDNVFHFFRVAKQAGLGIGTLSALIQAGACDIPTGKTRSRVVAEAQLWNILTDNERKIFADLGPKFNYDALNIMVHVRDEAAAKDAAGTKFKRGEIKTSRVGTIRKKFEPYNKILKKNSKTENFTNWYYQRQLLGFCYDETLKNIFEPIVYNLMDISEVSELGHEEGCVFMAVIDKVNRGVGQKENDRGQKTKYLKLQVSDEGGQMTVLVFNENIERINARNEKDLEEDDIVKIVGKRFNDAVFAHEVKIHSNEVFTKLSDLKTAEDKNTEKEEL